MQKNCKGYQSVRWMARMFLNNAVVIIDTRWKE